MRSLCFLSFFLLLASGVVAQTASTQNLNAVEATRPEVIYSKAIPSIALLSVQTRDGREKIGTAFLAMGDGLAVTAWHVIEGASRVTAKFEDRAEYEVYGVVDKDVKRDVALIRIRVTGRSVLPLAMDEPSIGQKAFVVGTPKGVGFSVSEGNVSRIQNRGGLKTYQFTCPATPGKSGGPLLDEHGRVIGIVSFQLPGGPNLNFATPAAYLAGLDSSLPTTPWANVTAPVSREKEADNRSVIDVPGIEVENTEKFFKTLVDGRDKSGQTLSETDDEHKKHAGHLLDTHRIYYFQAEQMAMTKPAHWRPFSYSLQDHWLNIRGGSTISDNFFPVNNGVIPIAIRCAVRVMEQTEATSGSGANVPVTPVTFENYAIGVLNSTRFPDTVIDLRHHEFGVRVQKPREEAERLFRDGVILVGVRFSSLDPFNLQIRRIAPSQDNPVALQHKVYIGYGEVVSVVLVDTTKHRIVARVEEKPESK
jgi:hypothetical protein